MAPVRVSESSQTAVGPRQRAARPDSGGTARRQMGKQIDRVRSSGLSLDRVHSRSPPCWFVSATPNRPSKGFERYRTRGGIMSIEAVPISTVHTTKQPAPRPDCARGLCSLLGRLCVQSVRDYQQPFIFPGWPEEMDRRQWFTSPELISLYGTPEWAELSEEQQQLVSFFEAVNFFSANVHGEAALMQGITARLYKPAHEQASPYLHHMLDEENKHSAYFSEFCRRYAGRIYADRMITLGSDPEDATDFLFHARVMIFEDVVDGFNKTMAADQRLDPTARWINDNHHREERRHLAFGRHRVRELFAEGGNRWSPDTLEQVQTALVAYLRALWTPLYNPEVYLDAGLHDPYLLAGRAYRSTYARAQRERLSRRSVGFLVRAGILPERPEL